MATRMNVQADMQRTLILMKHTSEVLRRGGAKAKALLAQLPSALESLGISVPTTPATRSTRLRGTAVRMEAMNDNQRTVYDIMIQLGASQDDALRAVSLFDNDQQFLADIVEQMERARDATEFRRVDAPVQYSSAVEAFFGQGSERIEPLGRVSAGMLKALLLTPTQKLKRMRRRLENIIAKWLAKFVDKTSPPEGTLPAVGMTKLAETTPQVLSDVAVAAGNAVFELWGWRLPTTTTAKVVGIGIAMVLVVSLLRFAPLLWSTTGTLNNVAGIMEKTTGLGWDIVAKASRWYDPPPVDTAAVGPVFAALQQAWTYRPLDDNWFVTTSSSTNPNQRIGTLATEAVLHGTFSVTQEQLSWWQWSPYPIVPGVSTVQDVGKQLAKIHKDDVNAIVNPSAGAKFLCTITGCSLLDLVKENFETEMLAVGRNVTVDEAVLLLLQANAAPRLYDMAAVIGSRVNAVTNLIEPVTAYQRQMVAHAALFDPIDAPEPPHVVAMVKAIKLLLQAQIGPADLDDLVKTTHQDLAWWLMLQNSQPRSHAAYYNQIDKVWAKAATSVRSVHALAFARAAEMLLGGAKAERIAKMYDERIAAYFEKDNRIEKGTSGSFRADFTDDPINALSKMIGDAVGNTLVAATNAILGSDVYDEVSKRTQVMSLLRMHRSARIIDDGQRLTIETHNQYIKENIVTPTLDGIQLDPVVNKVGIWGQNATHDIFATVDNATVWKDVAPPDWSFELRDWSLVLPQIPAPNKTDTTNVSVRGGESDEIVLVESGGRRSDQSLYQGERLRLVVNMPIALYNWAGSTNRLKQATGVMGLAVPTVWTGSVTFLLFMGWPIPALVWLPPVTAAAVTGFFVGTEPGLWDYVFESSAATNDLVERPFAAQLERIPNPVFLGQEVPVPPEKDIPSMWDFM